MIALRRYVATAIGIGISLAAVVWLIGSFDVRAVSGALRSADLMSLAPMPILLLGSFMLRAQRWRVILEHEPPLAFWPSFRALMIGYLLNNLLPARAGDVARVLELGRTECISRAKVLATLVTERTIDLATTLLILSLVLLAYPALPPWLKQAGMALSAFTALAVSVLAAAHLAGQEFIPWLHRLFSRWLPKSLGARLETAAFSALDGVAGMFRPRRAAVFVVLTLMIWGTEVSLVYLIANASGLLLAAGNALFVLLVLAIGAMVPSSPGFVGTYEVAGVAALGIVGVTGPGALAWIVLLHLVTLCGSTTVGSICFLLRPRAAGRSRDPETELP